MRTKFIVLTAAALAGSGCAFHPHDAPQRGVASVHVPVVTSADYVYDLQAPGGSLAPGEAERLHGWFATMGLGYGDSVYVDGPFSDAARGQVARVAGDFGMLVEPGAPVTAGAIQPDAVRVIVQRRRAEVPGCPDWSQPSSPNFQNNQQSNFGCGVNSNLAMQVANPEDLLVGRSGGAATDAIAGAKAIEMYRGWPLTGVTEGKARRPLDVVKDDTKGGN